MELEEVMRTTFAARDFTDEPLPDAVLYRILNQARFAPSGGNRQGQRVIIVKNAKTRDAIARLAEPAAQKYIAQMKAGENPWNTVVPSKVTQAEIEATPVPDMLLEPYKKAAVVLVFAVDLAVLAAMDQHLDRVGIIGGASIYPLVWNVLLAARNAGYGGTITTLPAASEPELQKLLDVPKTYAICAVVPLGKPVKQITQLSRKPVETFTTRETFGGEPFTADAP